MGNATGELPDRLHLLRLRELDFEIFLLGYVDEMEGEALRRFGPRAGLGARLRAGLRANSTVRGIVETAEKHNQGFFARPLGPNLDGLRVRSPTGSRGKLDRNP